MLIFQKTVDISVLREGFTIPISYQSFMLQEMGLKVPRGTKLNVKIDVGGRLYDAELKNIQFDETKYPTHTDLLQIRYLRNGELARALQAVFSHTANKCAALAAQGLSQRVTGWPKEEQELLAVYASPVPNQLVFEGITRQELASGGEELRQYGELVTEQLLEAEDTTASIIEQTGTRKIRKLNRSIGNDLKKLYGYRCQICGKPIGECYGSNLIHAHHINYFTRSLDNSAKNILIVCPNHHGIIHDQNPEFDFRKREYHYPNGFVEGLALNRHI